MVYNQADEEYNSLVRKILKFGKLRDSRAGNTKGLFGPQLTFDLTEGFPLLTSKVINLENVYHELTWFLRGQTNTKDLKCPQLWAPWADKDGECGPIYGKQWRMWEGTQKSSLGEEKVSIDQIQGLILSIKNNPTDRRLIVSAWNVNDLPKMALSPCHCFFQCYVDGEFLDLKLYQRSADVAIGVPYNIASYALLMHLIAKECSLKPRFLYHTFGDVHIYEHHLEKIEKQIEREPKPAPEISILFDGNIDNLAIRDLYEDISLVGYNPHPFIKFPLNI